MAARQRDWPRRDDRRCRPTTPSAARTSAPGSPCSPRCPDVWERRARRAARGSRPCPTRASARCCGRRSSAPGRRPPARPPRAAARLRREGDARGRRPHHVDRARRGVRGGRARRGRRGLRPRPRCARVLDDAAPRGSTSRRSPTRSRPSCSRSPCPGVPDVYQGSELWETVAGRPRQPPPGRLRPPRRRARRHRRGRRGDQAARHLLGADPAPRAARAVHRVHPGRRRRPAAGHVLAFDRGGAITVVTRLPVGLAAPAAGATRRSTCPRAAGTTCSPALDTDGRLADLLAVAPGRAAGEGRTDMTLRGPFDVWAPRPERVRLVAGRRDVVEMTRGDDGWWAPAGPVAERTTGVDYGYLLDDDPTRAPTRGRAGSPTACTSCSRRDRDDVRLERRRLDRPPARRVGDLRAARRHVHARRAPSTPRSSRLDHLRRPRRRPRRADAGQRVQRHPQLGLRRRRLVRRPRAATAARTPTSASSTPATPPGLGVVQDVVYNHLGPSGNYLPLFGPYLKAGRNTWGDLVNLDGEGSAEVRRYILDNVRMWLDDYHVDGLRLDAVHALSDTSAGAPARGDGDRGGRAVGAPAPPARP